MAESESSARYYCHSCKVEVQIAPAEDIQCPTCQEGFIEEVNERFEEDEFNDTVASSMNSVLTSFLNATRQHSNDSDEFGFVPPVFVRSTRPLRRPRATPTSGSEGNAGPSNGGSSSMEGSPGFAMDGPAGLDTLVQQLITSLIGNAGGLGSSGFLPGDYVVGQSAFDNIVTQLMNQLEPTGPAPATKEQIKSLESTTITQEQVDENLQCSVCFDEFKVLETVNKLPCSHLFHPSCITPWLERHGTCPICRKTLSGEDTSTLVDADGTSDALQNALESNNRPRMPHD